ncbi:hypothetical protein ACXHMN_31570 [Rhizobium sp. LEGMi12c]
MENRVPSLAGASGAITVANGVAVKRSPQLLRIYSAFSPRAVEKWAFGVKMSGVLPKICAKMRFPSLFSLF